MNLPVIVENKYPTIEEIVKALGVNRDILAPDDEIQDAWNSLPSVLKKVPKDKLSKGLVKMCVSVSVGLFDSAINYVWNSSIIELRNKVKNFGLNIVGQLLSKNDFDESKLNDLKDSELLDLCLKLNLITEDGFFFLDQCREIRNNFSAAHPTIGEIDNHEFINFSNRCIKYALSNENNPVGIHISEFLNILKNSKFSQEQQSMWIEKLSKTHDAQKEMLFSTLHGLYCDKDSSEETRVNSLNLCKAFKDSFSPNVKSNLIVQHQNYIAKDNKDKHRASQMFFEQLGILNLLSESEHHSLISNSCKRLMQVHLSIDNFYNEPPFAERLLELSKAGSIPQTAQEEFVETIVSCAIGNAYGVSAKALVYYERIIQNFSPKEISIMLDSYTSKNSIGKKVASYQRCKNSFKRLVELFDSSSIPISFQKIYDDITK